MTVPRLNLVTDEVSFDEHEALVRRLYGQWSEALSKAEWYRDEKVLSHLDHIAGFKPGRVLELCAGSGIVAHRLATKLRETEFVGVDISPTMCAKAAARCRDLPNVRVVEGDWLEPLQSAGTYDFIIVKNSLHLLRDLLAKLQRLKRVSHPGTRLVIVETVSPSQTSRRFVEGLFRIVDPHHVKAHFFTRPTLLTTLTKAGWGAYKVPEVINQLMNVDKWLAFKAETSDVRARAFDHIVGATAQVKDEMNISRRQGLFMLRRQLVSFHSLSD